MIIEKITEFVSSNPDSAGAYLIAGKILGAILLLPGTPLTLLAGATLGVFWGSIVAVIGNFLGAVVAFFIARYLFKDWVQNKIVVKYPKIEEFENRFVEHGLLTVILLRLIPLFPFNFLNYILGVTQLKARDYIIGTFFGIIPGTIAFVYFGEALKMLSIFHIFFSILAIVGLTYIGKHYEKKISKASENNKISIVQYKWAGSWGPFRIKIPCGECAVTQNIIEDVIKNTFVDYQDIISFEVKDWLPNWWRTILKGGWHAPIVTIDERVIFQGQAIDRDFLASQIRKELVKRAQIPKTGVIIYSKENCPYCIKAKGLLASKSLSYLERDVVKDPMATAEIFFHTKKFFPKNKPVTTPQIWIDGNYIGGSDELTTFLK